MESTYASGFCSRSIFPITHKSAESNSLRLPVLSYSSPVLCGKKVLSSTQNRIIIKRSSSDRISLLFKVSAERADGEAPSFSSVDSVISVVKRKKLAVFVSGGGSNFRSIQEACAAGSINGDIVLVVTNKKDCGGAIYARDNSIEVLLFPKSKNEPDGLSAIDLVNELRRLEVDFILLAGYLKLIPPDLIQAYPNSILNIHPSLLPAFGGKGQYGMKVHRAVIASGARFSGPTIHFVNEHYDEGRILSQRIVPVLATDTAEDLAARVLREEHKLYVEAASALCEERIVWRGDGVPLIQSKENPNEHY